ncbi:hypothetical protein U1Q18_008835 [Sarracenia purpurea var. burkii]
MALSDEMARGGGSMGTTVPSIPAAKEMDVVSVSKEVTPIIRVSPSRVSSDAVRQASGGSSRVGGFQAKNKAMSFALSGYEAAFGHDTKKCKLHPNVVEHTEWIPVGKRKEGNIGTSSSLQIGEEGLPQAVPVEQVEEGDCSENAEKVPSEATATGGGAEGALEDSTADILSGGGAETAGAGFAYGGGAGIVSDFPSAATVVVGGPRTPLTRSHSGKLGVIT